MWQRLRNLRPAIRVLQRSLRPVLPAALAITPLGAPHVATFCEGGLGGLRVKSEKPPPKAARSSTLDPSTPLDVRLGLTKAEDVAFPLRWGIIGAGPISSDWCKCLAEVPGARLEMVAARDAKKAADFATAHGVSRSCKSYDELVKDPAIDIVYIGTVTPMHKEHTLMAIAAGKHVLCEKPLAVTAADAREMYAAAEAKGVMLLEGMWTRYFPAVDHARTLVSEGVIGEVRMVQADFPEICYALQFAPLFLGAKEPPSAVVSAGTGKGGSGAVLQYGSRGCAMLSMPPWACESPEVCEVLGTEGRITLDLWGMHPTRITVQLTPEFCWDEPQGHTSTAQNGVQPRLEQHVYPLPQPAGLPAKGWNFVNQHGFIYQAQAIHRCLAAGLRECPQFTKAESLHIMDLLDKIEKGIEDPCR